MTQAPTPGPLTSESVKLLVKGDLLEWRGTAISLVRFHHANVMGVQVIDPRDGRRWTASPSSLTFIGRPDADGWMPWSGGENPVPGQMVEVRLRNGYEAFWLSGALGWAHDNGDGDIIAFRLAPTAPVEASGSEREEVDRLAKVYADATDYYVQFHRGLSSPSSDQIRKGISAVLAALRPQPSGETREVAQDIASLKGQFERIFSRSPEDRPAYKDGGQPFGHGDLRHFIEVLSKAEALLSARPLALGGQQGVPADVARLVVAAREVAYADTGSGSPAIKELDQAAEAFADRVPWDDAPEVTTPARADAQDEGAAGEAESYWFDPRDPEVTDTNPDNILIGYYAAFDVTMIQCGEMAMFGFWFEPADGSEYQYRYFSDRDQADAEALAQEAAIKAAGKPDAWLHRSKSGVGVYLTPGAPKVGVSVLPLYAHPSPTPAADADTVREIVRLGWGCAMTVACNIAIDEQNRANDDDAACEILNAQGEIIRRIKGVLDIDDGYMAEALAALKSTAAKEGGE